MKNKPEVSRTFNIAMTVILILSAVLMVYVTIRSLNEKPVMIGKKCVMQVVTGSMEPTLHTGECILIEKVPADSLKKGDIVAYISRASDIAGKTVTHRIADIADDGTLIMRGDANPADDPMPVSPEQVVGKYIRKSQFFTWLMSFADLRKVVLLVVMTGTSIMAFYEVRTVMSVGRETAEERRERIIRKAIDAEIERLKAEGYQPEEVVTEAPEPEGTAAEEVTEEPEPVKTVIEEEITVSAVTVKTVIEEEFTVKFEEKEAEQD